MAEGEEEGHLLISTCVPCHMHGPTYAHIHRSYVHAYRMREYVCELPIIRKSDQNRHGGRDTGQIWASFQELSETIHPQIRQEVDFKLSEKVGKQPCGALHVLSE